MKSKIHVKKHDDLVDSKRVTANWKLDCHGTITVLPFRYLLWVCQTVSFCPLHLRTSTNKRRLCAHNIQRTIPCKLAGPAPTPIGITLHHCHLVWTCIVLYHTRHHTILGDPVDILVNWSDQQIWDQVADTGTGSVPRPCCCLLMWTNLKIVWNLSCLFLHCVLLRGKKRYQKCWVWWVEEEFGFQFLLLFCAINCSVSLNISSSFSEPLYSAGKMSECWIYFQWPLGYLQSRDACCIQSIRPFLFVHECSSGSLKLSLSCQKCWSHMCSQLYKMLQG